MKEQFEKHVLPVLAILGVYGIAYYFLNGFRFSDPDQYFHFALSRHLAQTWDFWHLPQVKGMGWDQSFSDKEFLFHVFTALAYKIFGPKGVIYVCMVSVASILLLLYAITYRMTENRLVSLFAGVFPFFLETYILKLMQIRAYLPGVALVLLMIYFLITNRKKSLVVAGALFSLSYHALPVPVLVLGIWFVVKWLQGERDQLFLYGLGGLVAGMVVNPYFPSNIVMTITTIRVALAQFKLSGLDFGPEQVPYRSDNFILLFRYVFLSFAVAIGVLWLKFNESSHLKKMTKSFNGNYLFFGILSTSFFCLLFLSPRFQEYLIPFVAIYVAMSVACFKKSKRGLVAIVSIVALYQVAVRPFANFTHDIQSFQRFDNSYFQIVQGIQAPGYVFNCEWMSGHYLMLSRPDLQTVDVLDPSLLRSQSEELFQTVTTVRQGKTPDPYHVLNDILKVKYVLCSTSSPLNEQLMVDPRFQKLQQGSNLKEEIYLYKLRGPTDVGAFVNFETRQGSDDWKPFPRHITDPSLVYVWRSHLTECLDLRPTSEELKKMALYDFFVLSGRGDVIVYKDKQVYLNRTTLPDKPRWGEVLLPISAGKEWLFKICPNQKGQASLGVFLLSHHQQNLYCETNIPKLDPKAKVDKKTDVSYELSSSRCVGIRARQGF